MKYYYGARDEKGTYVVVGSELFTSKPLRGDFQNLPLQTQVRNHSPTGFEWGYGGSGPAQLALALCCDVFGEFVGGHPMIYQAFKRDIIAHLQHEHWQLADKVIALWFLETHLEMIPIVSGHSVTMESKVIGGRYPGLRSARFDAEGISARTTYGRDGLRVRLDDAHNPEFWIELLIDPRMLPNLGFLPETGE